MGKIRQFKFVTVWSSESSEESEETSEHNWINERIALRKLLDEKGMLAVIQEAKEHLSQVQVRIDDHKRGHQVFGAAYQAAFLWKLKDLLGAVEYLEKNGKLSKLSEERKEMLVRAIVWRHDERHLDSPISVLFVELRPIAENKYLNLGAEDIERLNAYFFRRTQTRWMVS